MNDNAKPSGAELVEGVLWEVLSEKGYTGGDKMRAGLALAELEADDEGLTTKKRKALRKIINAEAD